MADTEQKVVKKTSKKVVAKKVVTKKVVIKKIPINTKNKTINFTLIKSFWGRIPSHRQTVRGLGLRKIGQTRELKDTKAIRGMINKVAYLLKIN